MAKETKYALIAIILVGVGARLFHLFQPIRYDEAMSYLLFARLPWSEVVSDYHLPNNHVLHTLLVKAVTILFGNERWIIRLPVFVAGCLMLPLTFLVARRTATESVALLSTALVAGSGALILYSTNARGYDIVTDATLVLCWIALVDRDAPLAWHLPAFAVVTALGLWTIPTMLYPLGGVVIWTLIEGRGRRILIASLAGCLIAALLYLPAISTQGIDALIGNKYVTPIPSVLFFGSELTNALHGAWALFFLGVPPVIQWLLLICVIIGIITHWWRRPRSLPLILAMSGWCLVQLLVMHRFPFARVWLFLFPLLLISAAEGIIWLLTRFVGKPSALMGYAGALATTAVLVAYVILSRAVSDSRETGTLFDAEPLALQISKELQPGDRVLAATWAPLAYWLERQGADDLIVMGDSLQASRFLLVVNQGEEETLDQALSRFGSIRPAIATRIIAEFPHASLYAVTLR